MNPSLEEITCRADALYDARRHPGNVAVSVQFLQEAEYVGEYEALWRLGRAFFFLGQDGQSDKEKRTLHNRAIAFCKQATRLRPQRVEGHFWLGVNLALLAQIEKPLKALRLACRARRSLMRAVRLDAAYHAAGPLRVLARLQHKLPRILGGGGHARARANFERAIQLAPVNTITRLYFAEMLLEEGEKERARLELEALLNAPHDPQWAFESGRDREIARQMLDEIQS
jgi:tetratricopeptide (TPR) repeat protein